MNNKKKFKSLILPQQLLSQRQLHHQLQPSCSTFNNFNNYFFHNFNNYTSSTTTTTTTTTVYTGPFAEYAGFEGTNQTTLDELVKQLPPLLLQIIETNNISVINGCHQYGASLVGRCPYGVWDPSGTSSDGTKNAEWTLSIWISDRAFSAGVSYDVLLHESLHAFTYSTRNCPKNSTTLYRQDARDFFGGEEYLVDALVRYYGGAYNHYRTAGELDSSEQEYLTDYINTCSA